MDTGVRGGNAEEKTTKTRSKKEKSAILLEEKEPKHKKARHKKEYAIEWRLSPERKSRYSFNVDWDTWRVFKRYATEKQRDEALETMQRKSNEWWEYRAV